MTEWNVCSGRMWQSTFTEVFVLHMSISIASLRGKITLVTFNHVRFVFLSFLSSENLRIWFFFKKKKKKKILNVIYFIFQINWRIKCSFVGSENVSFFLN